MWIFLGVLAVLAFWIVGMYNGLVTKRNRFKNAFAQIDVQLKRRYDLIPNLVESVKGALAHEKETLQAVIQARNMAQGLLSQVSSDPSNTQAMQGLLSAEGQLGGALSRLMVVAEAYPDLKGNQNMLNLQEELTSTENRVSFARQAFNDAVTEYNTAREVFPNSMIANSFNFQSATLFEVTDPAEKAVPKVKF